MHMLLVQFLSFLPDPNERNRKGKKQGGRRAHMDEN